MAISASLVLITGVGIFALWRTGYQRLWPGLACILFGFTLASTGIAPGITHAIEAVSGWISALHV